MVALDAIVVVWALWLEINSKLGTFSKSNKAGWSPMKRVQFHRDTIFQG